MKGGLDKGGVLRFTLADIPTRIYPSAWVALLVLGSAPQGKFELLPALLFAVAGMLCLLAHEYGHALSHRALGGGTASITIRGFGGVTQSSHPPRTKLSRVLVTLAGPGGSLLSALAAGAVMGLTGEDLLSGIKCSLLLPIADILPAGLFHEMMTPKMQMFLSDFLTTHSDTTLFFFCDLFFVGVWWTLFNLLPILPMDGGQVLLCLTDNTRLTASAGMTVCALLTLPCLLHGYIFTLLILSYFFYVNMKILKFAPTP